MRTPVTIEEMCEIRTEEIEKILKAFDEVLTIERFLKNGNFKCTKEILYRDLKKAVNIGK